MLTTVSALSYISTFYLLINTVASLDDKAGLLGKSPQDAALIQQWISFTDTDLLPQVCTPPYMNLGYQPFNKTASDTAFERATKFLTFLEEVLKTRTFLVGERITLADITLGSVLLFGFQQSLDKKFRAKFPHTVRYFESVANNHVLKSSFGEYKYLDTFKLQPPKKDEKKKEEKPKEQSAPQAPAPAPAPEKPKNPLDLLPKSSFVLEDFKRHYSNWDTRGDDPTKHSLAYFYKNFVPEDYTIVRVDFKYNDELTHVFMSNNQIGGLFTRMEASRKYLFGSAGVLKNEAGSMITGIMIVRGKDYMPVLQVAPDWESYSWTPIDISKEEDKKFFEGAMAWDLEVDGKVWVDGKNLK